MNLLPLAFKVLAREDLLQALQTACVLPSEFKNSILIENRKSQKSNVNISEYTIFLKFLRNLKLKCCQFHGLY